MNRTLSTALVTMALAACGGNAASSGAPAPAAARKLTLTYFTMTG